MGVMDRVTPLDRAIVAALQLNGRAPWNEIARHVGAEPRTVMRRAARLEELGLVRVVGFVDVLRCGLGVPVQVRYRCRPGTASHVADTLAAHPQMRFVASLAGSTDCVAEMVVPRYQDVGRVLESALGSLPEVSEAESLPVLHTFTSAPDWDPGLLEEPAVEALRVGTGAGGQPFESGLREEASEALDEIDVRIVRVLGESGRMPFKDVAERADCSERTVGRRVERLLNTGCLRFRTLAEPEVLDYEVEFMLWLAVDPAELDRTGRALAAHPSTKYLAATAGRYNLVGQMVLRRYGELYPYSTEVVGGLPGVRAADLTLQLRTLKRAWTPTRYAPLDDPRPLHGPLPPPTSDLPSGTGLPAGADLPPATDLPPIPASGGQRP
jgi:DNA-binding Lrp family transcriptional regulator